jgi:TetR/AcrR family acrAB operon transcriptional repressor
MARKTKEEALATRSGILDAAERLFQAQGVSRTSLHEIAVAAGVTRGAVYWHFKDKSDLFIAMVDRVRLPMEEASATLDQSDHTPALPALRAQLLDVLVRITRDSQVHRVFDIATHKIEYVDELNTVRSRHLQARRDYLARLERTLQRGQRQGEVVTTPSARQLAIGVHALLVGLIQNWMLDPDEFDLRSEGARAVDTHLVGLTRR